MFSVSLVANNLSVFANDLPRIAAATMVFMEPGRNNFKLDHQPRRVHDAARSMTSDQDVNAVSCGTFSGPWMVNRKMQGTFSREKQSVSAIKREDSHPTFIKDFLCDIARVPFDDVFSMNDVEQNGHATWEADNTSFEHQFRIQIWDSSANMPMSTLMSSRLKKQLIQYLYKLYVVEVGGMELFKYIETDFLDLSLNAMQTLFEERKNNLVHSISKCFERRESGTETRLPLKRMPFGLIDYNLRFFAADFTQKLGVQEHYAQWMETMFSHFGHKWVALHRGPCWQYEELQDKDAE